MSFYSARQVLDGLKNAFQNIPLAALAATGTPSGTTFLRGDGTWNTFLAPPPAYDSSAKSTAQSALASGTPFTWSSAGGTAGAYGIVLVDCTPAAMTLAATAAVTWGGVPMTSLGRQYKNNVTGNGWVWVFGLNGISAGAQTVSVTMTQSGQTFTGWGSSYSYTNVSSVGPLQTAFGGTGTNPSVSVTAANPTDIVWGAVDVGAHTVTGFSLTTRQSSTGALVFSAGDTTGSTNTTISGTASTAAWAAVGLDLVSIGGALAAPSTGSQSVEPVSPAASNYTTAAGEMVPCNAASAPFTVTLPTAPVDGANIVLKKIDSSANAVSFACGGSDVLNVASGPTSGTLSLQYQAIRLQYYAPSAIWYVISADIPLSQEDARYVRQQTPTFVEYIGNTSTTAGVTNATVPSGILGVEIVSLIAPGAGGGSGRLSTSGTIAGGGGGGGAGSLIENLFIPASALGATYSVSVPAAGLGGAAVSTASTNGNPGTAPSGVASFTSGSTAIRSQSGNFGAGGTNAAGGTAGAAPAFGMILGAAGGAGSSTTAAATGGFQSLLGGPAGGGGGGAVTATPAASNGGAGGFNNVFGGAAAAAGGIAGGASPGTGAAALSGQSGAGPGGGAGATSGAAQAGANGAGYGVGGGGGGGSIGTSSGAGGNGGPGYCGLRWVYS